MKKLMFFLAVFSVGVQAHVVDALEKAVRDVDVNEVRCIVSRHPLVCQDKERFCVLADEVVRDREEWTRKAPYGDVTTPYEPAWGKLLFNFLGALGCFVGAKVCSDAAKTYETRLAITPLLFDGETNRHLKMLSVALSVGGLIYALKLDSFGSQEYKKQRELLRKKYEDALTIKRLIYSADIV